MAILFIESIDQNSTGGLKKAPISSPKSDKDFCNKPEKNITAFTQTHPPI